MKLSFDSAPWSKPSCSAIASLDFDDAAAEPYGLVRAQLKRAGTPIGPNDLIAAIALANDASLATRNIGEFSRVPPCHWLTRAADQPP